MSAAWKMTKTELKLFLRDPMAMFFTLLFPLMMLFLFGSIFGNEPDPDLGGRGSVDVSVPGYLAVIIATNAIMGCPSTWPPTEPAESCAGSGRRPCGPLWSSAPRWPSA